MLGIRTAMFYKRGAKSGGVDTGLRCRINIAAAGRLSAPRL